MAPPAETPGPRSAARRAAGAALLLAPALAVFLPALGYPFLSLDDAYYVVHNPAIRDLSWEGVRFLFLEDTRDLRYFPLTYLSFAVDHRLFGLDPFGFHLTSLALHLANTLLVVALFRVLTGDALAAAATGLLFSIHPLQVESVAWVMSRKNVLFFFFFLLGALAYVAFWRRRARGAPGAGWALGASAGCYLLACLAKTAAITLPALLLVLDFQLERGRRGGVRDFLRRHLPSKAAFLPPALVVVAAARAAHRDNPFSADYAFSAWEWALLTGHNLFFYVWRTLVPAELGVFYPLPPAGALPPRFAVFAALALALLAAAAWAVWRGRRLVALGLGWYLVTVLPMAVILLVFSDLPLLVADRYYYQSAPGLLLLPAAAFSAAWRRRPALRPALAVLAVAGVGTLGALAAEHRAAWRSTPALYEALLAHHPSDEFAYRLALERMEAGEMQAAFAALDAAERAPHRIYFMHFLEHHLRIAELYRRRGDFARAAEHVRAGIEATPNPLEPADARSPLAWRYLASLWERAGDAEAAAAARRRAAAAPFDPALPFASTWFVLFPEEAGRFLEEESARDPGDPLTWIHRAALAELRGDPARARAHLERARRLERRRGGARPDR